MIRALVFFCTLCCTVLVQAKRVELVLWHGMAGQLGAEVQRIADDFNHSQQRFSVKPVYKGNYLETLTSFAAAFRAHKAPAMVQVFEVGTPMMLAPAGVIKPVDLVMQEQGLSLPKEDFIPSVRDFYSRNGQLMALPFNLSVPVLYYNKDLLKKAGYTGETLPQTWQGIEQLARQVKKSGYDCTYTSAYPGWILIESYIAIHGLSFIQNNPLKALFDTPQLATHLQRLKRWSDLHYFRYGGRVDDATVLFISGVCPLFSQSSGAYNSLSAIVPFHIGVASMPLDIAVTKIRHANVAGGGALWATSGQSTEEYQGIARFFAFIAKAKTQKIWHEHTGYLPLGLQGRYAAISETSTHPVLKLARKDLAGADRNPLQSQNQIRIINDEILEALFAGLYTSDEALYEAVSRSNRVLLRFVKNTQ